MRFVGPVIFGVMMLSACGQNDVDSVDTLKESQGAARYEAQIDRELLGQGEAIAEQVCANCHAIRAADESVHSDAPAFRMLSKNYEISFLAESLVEGMMVGHPDMPEFQFDAQSAEALITYIESVQLNE